MASPATARRSEPLSSNLNVQPSPLRPTRETTSRASTPRPSISPLSTASRTNRSPVATRDLPMPDTEVKELADSKGANQIEAEVGDRQDDDSSSILSEPDDEQDDLLISPSGMGGTNGHAQLAAQNSLEVDSEAETERLEETPQKLRKHADSVGKTPSKLSQAATMEDELSDPPSPIPEGAGAASSTSTIGTLQGQKRKRSDTAESSLTSAASDLGESPRKRNHESPTLPEQKEAEEEAGADDISEPHEEVVVDAPTVEEALVASAVTKGPKGKKGKPRGRKPAKEIVAEAEPEEQEETAQQSDEASEEKNAKTLEERQHKNQASSMFEDVAKQFAAFRERLYDERLATMNAELEMLKEEDCRHPEYLLMAAAVDRRRAKQVHEINAHHNYKYQSIRQRTLGDRSQLHSQYFQEIRRLREDVLYDLGEDWYNIQKERRQQHQEQDEKYIFKFPTKKSAQITQQAKYNQEVSVLSGVAKHVGFPAAPEITSAKGEELEDDFKAMKIAKRVQQTNAHRQQQPPAQAAFYMSLPSVSAQNERLAHEQFIEQNAWAQPQRPIHTHGTPNMMQTHTPDWAEPQPSARNLIRNLSGQMHTTQRTGSPYMTPLPQKRAPPQELSSSGTVAVNSDGAEIPSSVAAAPPTSDRLPHFHHPRSSPLVVNKQRQNGGSGEKELTGFRNISAVSGASTIDAIPSDSPEAVRHEHQQHAGKTLPALLSEVSAPRHAFDANQSYRPGREREVSSTVSFRPQDGAFGTPAPLQTAANVPPGSG